jgi:choline dehydrogenase-like flavoprotein
VDSQRPFAPNTKGNLGRQGARRIGAINGMIYNRGSQADFDHLADLGLSGWSWDQVVSAYREIEDNALGNGRGSGDHCTCLSWRCRPSVTIIAAGGNLGWQMDDYNESDTERIGCTMCTIKNGER